ncbi:hypothetical protein Pan153_24530 [Gimesia panareensis]|uniref:Uncharacterized protein n=1 Tax=Gimesia panareensis TaxID=2527978 RepID=A0A518FN68_9PLAN|nr:hypothetical protein Pan153_24530 [Gimesia panareensis]
MLIDYPVESNYWADSSCVMCMFVAKMHHVHCGIAWERIFWSREQKDSQQTGIDWLFHKIREEKE